MSPAPSQRWYRQFTQVRHCLSTYNEFVMYVTILLYYLYSITALYGAEAWSMRSAERWKVNVLEMKCLRSLVGVSRMDSVRNEEVCYRARIVGSWRVEKIREYWDGLGMWNGWVSMPRRVSMAEESGGRVLGIQRLGSMDGVKVTLGNRGMTVEAARQCAKDRKEWRVLLHK